MFEAIMNKDIPSFEDWVRDELNPYRVLNNMLPLSDEEIEDCKKILDDFSKLWRKDYGIDKAN